MSKRIFTTDHSLYGVTFLEKARSDFSEYAITLQDDHVCIDDDDAELIAHEFFNHALALQIESN